MTLSSKLKDLILIRLTLRETSEMCIHRQDTLLCQKQILKTKLEPKSKNQLTNKKKITVFNIGKSINAQGVDRLQAIDNWNLMFTSFIESNEQDFVCAKQKREQPRGHSKLTSRNLQRHGNHDR